MQRGSWGRFVLIGSLFGSQASCGLVPSSAWVAVDGHGAGYAANVRNKTLSSAPRSWPSRGRSCGRSSGPPPAKYASGAPTAGLPVIEPDMDSSVMWRSRIAESFTGRRRSRDGRQMSTADRVERERIMNSVQQPSAGGKSGNPATSTKKMVSATGRPSDQLTSNPDEGNTCSLMVLVQDSRCRVCPIAQISHLRRRR